MGAFPLAAGAFSSLVDLIAIADRSRGRAEASLDRVMRACAQYEAPLPGLAISGLAMCCNVASSAPATARDLVLRIRALEYQSVELAMADVVSLTGDAAQRQQRDGLIESLVVALAAGVEASRRADEIASQFVAALRATGDPPGRA